MLFYSLNGILKKTRLSKKKWRLSLRITALRTGQDVHLKKQGEKGEAAWPSGLGQRGRVV